MRQYEVMYILKPDLETEATAGAVQRFSQLIAAQGGRVLKVEQWGKRRLAYEVKKYREGYYILAYFEGEPAAARELERVLKIADEVVIYLLLQREVPASVGAIPDKEETIAETTGEKVEQAD